MAVKRARIAVSIPAASEVGHASRTRWAATRESSAMNPARAGRGTCSSVSSDSTVWKAPSWNGSGPAGAWIAVIDGATFAGNSTSSPTKGTPGCAQAKPCGPQPTSSRLPSGRPSASRIAAPAGA